MVHHPSNVPDVVEFTPVQIFEEYLPLVLKQQTDIAKQIDAIFTVKIRGENGGEWTINLTDQTVKSGAVEQADLSLALKTEDFQRIIEGKLDAEEAFSNNLVEIEGRPQLLASLAALLRPAD